MADMTRWARWLPVTLAVVSWVVGWVLVDVLTQRAAMLWAIIPTALLVVFRVVVESYADGVEVGSRTVLFAAVLHTAITVVAVLINPFACIYAFVGYLDAGRFFRGRQIGVVVVITALVCALGQAGSFPGLRNAPLLFVALCVINLVVAGTMMHFSLEQERQIEARERALEELDRATQENLALQSQLVEQARTAGIAEERARLSREIHDTVAQGLVGVIRQLEAVPDGLPHPARDRVARAEHAARECLVEARRAVQALAPHQLSNGDLVEAVGNLSAEWARTHRVVIEFDADEAPAQLDHGPVLLRVLQESLANVARHAQASNVKVVLRGSDTEEEVVVADDGVGFDPDRTASGHGLPGMVARVSAVGGRLAIASREGQGCMITATVPR